MTTTLVPYLQRLESLVEGSGEQATGESASGGQQAGATLTPGASQSVIIENVSFSMPIGLSAVNVGVEVIDADENVLWIGDVGGLAATVAGRTFHLNLKGPVGKALTARFASGVSGLTQKVSIVGRFV